MILSNITNIVCGFKFVLDSTKYESQNILSSVKKKKAALSAAVLDWTEDEQSL